MDTVHPAPFPLTKDNHAAWVVVITITFFFYTFGAVTTKLSIRYKAAGWRPNDTVLAFALLVLLVQSICVVTSCKNGLGKHQHSVTSEELDKFDRVYLFLPSRIQALSNSHLTCPGIALLVSVCITASQCCYISLQQSLHVSPYRRHLQLWKTAYGESRPARSHYHMCCGSNLWCCLRMCSAHAMVYRRYVPRV